MIQNAVLNKMEERIFATKVYCLDMDIRKGIVLLISLIVFGNSFAQESEETPTTLEAQFETVVNKSNSYKNYKVIEYNKLKTLKSNMIDSVQLLYKEVAADKSIIKEQKTELSELNAEIDQLEGNLEEAIAEKNAFFFLGMQIGKDAFKNIFWIVSIGLLLVLIFFIFKYIRSQKLTVDAKLKLAEAENELEEQRKKHIKKEQETKRRLQDEINKNAQ